MARPKLLPDNFTLALVGTVIVASLLPCRGTVAVGFNWLTNVAIGLLFFLHGAKLSREAIISGATHWRLHLVVLLSTFVMFPLLGLALKPVLTPLVTPAALHGHSLPVHAALHGAIVDRVHVHGQGQRARRGLQRVGLEPARHFHHARCSSGSW